MKRMKKLLLVIMIMIPIFVKAGSYTSEVAKANNFINLDNYKNSYDKYVINRKETTTIKFEYYNGTIRANSSFINAGFISKSEYELTVKNGGTYIFDGIEYWTLTKDGSNVYAITYDNMGTPKNPDNNYSARVTEYLKPTAKIKGKGTLNDPWTLDPVYKVEVATDSRYATITSDTVQYVRGLCSQSDCTATFAFQPKEGYRHITQDCDAEYNDSTNIMTVKNVKRDTKCTLVYGLGLYKIGLPGATPSTIYLKYGNGFYTSSQATNLITKLTANPTQTGSEFKGFKTEDGIQIIDETGKIDTTKNKVVSKDTDLLQIWQAK